MNVKRYFANIGTIYVNNHTFFDNTHYGICEIIGNRQMEMNCMLAFKYKQIGRKIAYYRRMKNLTQGDLARKINISTSYLSKIECGSYPKSVSLSVLIAIAQGLDMELYLLFKFDEESIVADDLSR